MAVYLAVKNFRTWAMKKNLVASGTPNHLNNIQGGSPNVLLFEDPLGCTSCSQTMITTLNEIAKTYPSNLTKSNLTDSKVEEEEQDMDDEIIDKVVNAVKGIVKESQADRKLGENRKIRFKMSWLIKKTRKGSL